MNNRNRCPKQKRGSAGKQLDAQQHGSKQRSSKHSRSMAAFTQHGSIHAAWQHSHSMAAFT
ncbi:hypothetical protein BDZ91DRAFT_801255 [Kalaharituber pfeilii]|nr:hypothetical protein BDZ91DRAFT_801255 [Kalaharituber pfeilii]